MASYTQQIIPSFFKAYLQIQLVAPDGVSQGNER